MKIMEAIIKKGEWLLDALKRIGYDMIPTSTILYKLFYSAFQADIKLPDWVI